jgi:hypothetical protein
VIDIIEHDVIPVIRKCALAGVALYNTEQELFFAHPQAAEMLADVLSERGYYVTWQASDVTFCSGLSKPATPGQALVLFGCCF